MVKFPEEKAKRQLQEIRNKEVEDLAQILAKKYNLPYLDLSLISISTDSMKIISEAQAKEAKMAIFQKAGKKLQIGILSTNLDSTKNLLEKIKEKGFKIDLYMVSEASLKRAWIKYSDLSHFSETTIGVIDISSARIAEFMKTATLENLKELFSTFTKLKKKQKITEVIEVIMAGGIRSDASDIHIEPEENSTRLRLRLDGVLHDVIDFNKEVYNLLLSRIKLVSGLKLNIKKKAQDGRFSIHLPDTEIEIRVSIIPGTYGESIVMRLLNPKSIRLSFEELGINKYLYEILSKEIKKPNGMIITTGPTGSGKTTTLYSILRKIHNSEIKIITLEDPVEYHLKGVIQTQIKESRGYTFSSGLRAILRQDPDILMVGEVRDLETAKISINAALTGHLVLSTLHTNNAAGTIPRLIDLGVNPNIIAPALNITLAQRLIRKLCTSCRIKDKPTKGELTLLKQAINSFPKHIEVPKLADIEIYNAEKSGCKECNGIGYKGRIGVHEAILIDNEIEKLILSKPSEADIDEIAKKQGILNLAQDGILKVINGTTSLSELQRVVELEF